MKIRRTLVKGVSFLFGGVFLILLLLFVSMSIFNSPTYAWRVLRYGQSDTNDYKIFPERAVARDASFSSLPGENAGTPDEVEYPYDGGTRKEKLDDLLKRTDTSAFLIIKDDRLILETYINSSRDDVHTSFSSAKSFNSALIGAAIADGYIGSVNDPVIQYIPEIAGRGWMR